MRLIRSVPITPAMMAVGEAMDNDDQAVIDDKVFADWWHDPAVGRGTDYVLNRLSMSVNEVQEVLPVVPDTPAGRVWAAAAEKSLALTLTDIYRPHDQGEWEADEQVVVDALDTFAEELRELSPLLEEVASIIEVQAAYGTFYLGEVLTPREKITETGIVLGRDGWCEKHGEACYGDARSVATWEHLEFIAPGIQIHLRGLLERLDASLPALGDADNLAGRYGRPYR